ncbi:MT-A70 family methyltransferase [Devosia ginsengisoli]|uniref:MT-A70 family methyltransferase n=1 Tax=Devosia ginsengisoli TaxID=400770 RepID=UPI0026EFF369|nr:MT-A70 family methyltransferase [Devosia ginsengisoli]MCR6672174.1 MT-A70 family methyltransferase [Devosia ginsengisoli]
MALPEAKFGVILADPEWKFETYSEETGMDRAADNHYPTSTLEAIKSRDVGSLAADACVLFLWATVPMLPQALDVMAAWGFEYKSHTAWRKDRAGTGYWFRNEHELLLVGTRGNVPAPAMGDQFGSVIDAPVGEHSAKPEKFYEIIEAYFPSLPKIELNARVARQGWVRWGYEAPDENSGQVAACAPVAPCSDAHGDENGLRLKGNATLAQPSVGTRESDALAEVSGTSQCEDSASPTLPNSPLPLDQADAIIRTGDADKTPLVALAAMVGRPGNITFVKNSRRRQGLSSRERQREAVAESNRRRAAVAGEAQ